MSRKILAVDDNVELLELLRLNFKRAGFAILTATNGVDALKKARSLSPDLILLDLLLPELDGFTVCEVLRHDPATASIPIIVLTGLTSQLSRIASLESGANEYVTKPTSVTQLIAKMKALLHRPQARSRSARSSVN
jgi:DNA-binding response OmpR family regulator